nr:hypothetical protein [Tanacetum cinerariifolium]
MRLTDLGMVDPCAFIVDPSVAFSADDPTKVIGADNHPPMLEKDMYDSWKSIMELYMMNRQHGRMILESVKNSPLFYSPPSSIPQMEYAPTLTQQQQQYEFPQLDSGLTILVFKQGDDPIDSINHIMSFLYAVVTSRFPTTNNQLRNSSNPRKQATINDGRVTLQPVQGSVEKGQNVEVKSRDNFLDSHEQNAEIDRIKQTLSEHIKEKESLIQTVNHLKNDFKKEESRIIDREIALEKKIKHLDNIVYKRDQSSQTVHMLTKPNFFYDHTPKQALGFQNPFYLIKAQQLEPKLYDGNVIKNTCAIVIPDSKKTLILAEKSRSKMILKQQDPMVLEKKVNTTPVDYVVLNQLFQDFEKRFISQTEFSAEQAFWSQNSINFSDHSLFKRPTKVEVPK